MAKIIGRRPVKNDKDKLWYICEIGKDYVYQIADNGYESDTQCLEAYLLDFIGEAQRYPLYDVNKGKLIPLDYLQLDIATHILQVLPDKAILINEDKFDPWQLRRHMLENLHTEYRGIIF